MILELQPRIERKLHELKLEISSDINSLRSVIKNIGSCGSTDEISEEEKERIELLITNDENVWRLT